MNRNLLGVLGAVTMTLLTGGAYAAGGTGQGGTGAGNEHGAATAGMTYHGEPVSSPWLPTPIPMTNDDSAGQNTSANASADTSAAPATNVQHEAAADASNR